MAAVTKACAEGTLLLFFSSRRRHTRLQGDWSSDVCSSDLGHHADAHGAMGFCLINNVAVAARHMQAEHGVRRIAIVDFDVHHGNGTQDIFEHDNSVLYASLHQTGIYPGTGAADEGGATTVNVPLRAGGGDGEWLAGVQRYVEPPGP